MLLRYFVRSTSLSAFNTTNKEFPVCILFKLSGFFEYVFSLNAVYHNKCQLAISILYLLRNAVICRVVITKCHVLDNLNLCSYSPSGRGQVLVMFSW